MAYSGQRHIVLGPRGFLATCLVCGGRLHYPDAWFTGDSLRPVINLFLARHRGCRAGTRRSPLDARPP